MAFLPTMNVVSGLLQDGELTHDQSVKVVTLYFIALFNNMQTLKFKAKLMITLYAAVNHNCNGHPKAETSKMDQNPPITNQEHDLLTLGGWGTPL